MAEFVQLCLEKTSKEISVGYWPGGGPEELICA